MSLEEREQSQAWLESLNAAIRENPLAAGVIGAGIAWMLLGTKPFAAAGRIAAGTAGGAASVAASAGRASASVLNQTASDIASSARSAAPAVVEQVASIIPDISTPEIGSLSDSISETAARASAAAGDQLQSIAASGKHYGAIVQSRLSAGLERQPLLLGAIGAAIGAGLASAIATTPAENAWFGEKGEAAREGLRHLGEATRERAREVVSEVQTEVARQGLTADAAKDAVATIAGKVKTVATSAGKQDG
jgi:hypothetical protein